MIKAIETFYNKENFDCSKGYVDPFQYHKTFYYVLRSFQVVENEPITKWSNFSHIFKATCAIIGLAIAFMGTCHAINEFDISLMTEAGTYCIILFYKLLILMCPKINLTHYRNLLRIITEDFHYICTEGGKYRKKFFQNQLQIWKTSLLLFAFLTLVGIGMISFTTMSLLIFLVTHEPEDGGKRPLLFPFWIFNVDFGKSPVYEMAFIYSNACVLSYCYSYIFMMQTQIVWVKQITTKADLIIWSLQDLLVDVYPTRNKEKKEYFKTLVKNRIRKILFLHHSMYSLMEDYAGVYKKLLMYEQKLCSPVVCLTAYCTAEKWNEGEFHAILFLICVVTIIMVFVPSYLCTCLAEKVRSICDACWGTQFWKSDSFLRPYLVLIMQRSLRPLPLNAPGFEKISMETFASKMSSAYSFFNMLRQINQ